MKKFIYTLSQDTVPIGGEQGPLKYQSRMFTQP